MLKVTHPVGGAAADAAVKSYMENRGSWRVISKTWNCVLDGGTDGGQGRFRVRPHPLTPGTRQEQQACVLPGFASNKSLDVQVHWDVLGGDDGDLDAAGQVGDAGVDHVALALKDALSEDQHRPDDGFWNRQTAGPSLVPS